MKKLLSKILTVVLCLCLVFALAACGTAETTDADADSSSDVSSSAPKKPTIVGKWQNEMNITELLSESDDPSVRAMIAYLSEEPIVVSITLDFKEGGTVDATVDASNAVVAIQSLITTLEEQDTDLAGLLLQSLDLDSLPGNLGGTTDEEPDAGAEDGELLITREMINSIIDEIKALDPEEAKQTTEGAKYRYEDGKLYCIEIDGELDENSYVPCTLTDSTLTFTGIESDEPLEGIEIPEFEMPEIIFNKVAK